MTISLKNIEILEEKHDFRGCGFFEFSKFSIFGGLTIVSYTRVALCSILYSFLRGFSLWQRGIDSTKQMTVYEQITLFIKKSNFSIFLTSESIFDKQIDFPTKKTKKQFIFFENYHPSHQDDRKKYRPSHQDDKKLSS